MVLQRTLTVQTARVCVGKSREEIVDEVSKAFSIHPVVAIQVGFDIIRVTFRDSDSCKLARNNTHVNIFGSNCIVQGGGPPPTMVHLFDFPAELGDEPVRQVLSGYGNVRSVRRQRYIGRPDIETGTRLVLMTFRVTPPRSLIIGGYMCRLWYRGQPLVCNLCNEQGHKSADCPNKDKCRRCGQSGHFARSCPTPWGPVARVESAASAEFPALGDSSVSGLASGPAVSLSSEVVDRAVDQACDSFLSVHDLFGDIDSISDDSGDSICNDSLDDLMVSDVEDSNVECSKNVNINTETVPDHVSDTNVRNETSVTVNAVSDRAVPVCTLDTSAHGSVNPELNNAAVSGTSTGPAVDENTQSSDKEISANVHNVDISNGKSASGDKETSTNANNEMSSINDDTINGDVNTSNDKINDEGTSCVIEDVENSNAVDSVASDNTMPDAPKADGGLANPDAGGGGEMADDCMDYSATQDSQTPEVEDGEIIEVTAAGFSGSSAMDVIPEGDTGYSQPSTDVEFTESPCSTNDAQILSPSQEEASQSILVPVEGWPADPPSSGPQRKTKARSARKSGRHTMPPVVPVVPSRSGSRHRPRHR